MPKQPPLTESEREAALAHERNAAKPARHSDALSPQERALNAATRRHNERVDRYERNTQQHEEASRSPAFDIDKISAEFRKAMEFAPCDNPQLGEHPCKTNPKPKPRSR